MFTRLPTRSGGAAKARPLLADGLGHEPVNGQVQTFRVSSTAGAIIRSQPIGKALQLGCALPAGEMITGCTYQFGETSNATFWVLEEQRGGWVCCTRNQKQVNSAALCSSLPSSSLVSALLLLHILPSSCLLALCFFFHSLPVSLSLCFEEEL